MPAPRARPIVPRAATLLLTAMAGLWSCRDGGADTPTPVPSAMIVDGAWVRSGERGASTEVFFTLTNPDTAVDTLRGVQAEDADSAALHVTMEHSEIVQMATVRALPLPARDSVLFRPLGTHVMLVGLRRTLADGDSIALTLSFGSGKVLVMRAGVRAP